MPVKRRTITTPLEEQVVPKVGYVPSGQDKLASFPREMQMRASIYMYGLSEVQPKHTPIEDIAFNMRMANDTKWPVEQTVRNAIKGRLSAIRAFCVTCAGGYKAARMCQCTSCPLFAFRMGSNPFLRKS